MWVWVNTYRYIFSGMNIHLPAILGFTRYQGFDPFPCLEFRTKRLRQGPQVGQTPAPRHVQPLRPGGSCSCDDEIMGI